MLDAGLLFPVSWDLGAATTEGITMRMTLQIARIGMLLSGLVAAAQADSVSLFPTDDNVLYSTAMPTSNGAGASLYCGRTGPHGLETPQRPLIRFSIADSVPVGSTIQSVTLRLFQLAAGPTGDQTLSLHRLLADWGAEDSIGRGGSGADAQPGDATWNHTFFPSSFWTTPGGDFAPTSSSSAVVGQPIRYYTWDSTTRLVADVQDMLNNPDSDFGWLLLGNEDAIHTARRFGSADETGASRPLLTIEFSPAVAVPVGSSRAPIILGLVLLAIGAAVLHRK